MRNGVCQRRPSSIAGPISSRSRRERVELVAVGEEADEQVAERAVGGLDARWEQHLDGGKDRVVIELVAVDFAADEVADEVVARRATALADEGHEVGTELLQRPQPALGVVEHVDQVDRPALEAGDVSLG